MRLVTRLIAIGLLLAAILTVLLGIVWQRGSGSSPSASAGTHGGAASVVVLHHSRNGNAATSVSPAATQPPPKPATHKSHKPAKPIPPNAQIPIMVLNSNGIHGAAHRLAAQIQSFGYPVTYVGNAQRHGLPTIVQYSKGYGPAARKLARRLGNVQFVTPLDGITPVQAGRAKLVIILGT